VPLLSANTLYDAGRRKSGRVPACCWQLSEEVGKDTGGSVVPSGTWNFAKNLTRNALDLSAYLVI